MNITGICRGSMGWLPMVPLRILLVELSMTIKALIGVLLIVTTFLPFNASQGRIPGWKCCEAKQGGQS